MKIVEYENLKKTNYPFFAEFQNKFQSVLDSGWFILGKEVQLFEQNFAKYVGVKHCIGLASGFDALIIALTALNLPSKSEVLISANAYIACILSILRADLVPVLVEPCQKTSNIDVNKIEQKITAKTKAIMPVHLYGYPCDMENITALAKKYNLHIVEDCAQAHGAQYFSKNVGTFSSISAFSFFPTKNLGALGDAGAALTNDDELADKLRALRNYGSQIKYHTDHLGFNSRLDEVQAGFLNVKLPYLDKITNHKRSLAALYDAQLDERFIKPKHQTGYYGVYHIYNIYHPERENLRKYLKDHGITTEVHYPISPFHQKALAGMFEARDYPVSERLHQQTISLPISYLHTPEDIAYVCEVLNGYDKN